MAYGLIYTTQFDNLQGETHTLDIYKKDYVGSVTDVICGAGAVRQVWGPDERNPPIKGCNIEVELLNIEGSFPLSNFYSNEDDTFKCIHTFGAQVTFVGFIVYDDCSEEQIDFTHNISLSATDNLGLLKDVALNRSPKTRSLFASYPGTFFYFQAPNLIFSVLSDTLLAGDVIVITGTAYDGTYNITGSQSPLNNTMEEVVVTMAGATGTIAVYRSILQGRYPLSTILKWCFAPTVLELDCHVYSNLIPVGGATDRWLDDTFIDTNTWLNNDENYEDCYKILEDIMARFRCTLFQANGVWNVVRWNELRYGTFLYYIYDQDMAYVDDEVMAEPVTIGTGSDIETGLIASLIRPFKMVQEKFDYKQPVDILRNAGFQRLGPLLAEYTVGLFTVREYGMTDWDVGYWWNSAGTTYIPSTATRFVRVVYNSFNEEIERYGVVKGATGMFDSRSAAESYPVEVRPGDRIRISWDWKTNVSQAGNVNIFFKVNILTTASPTPRSLNNRDLNEDGTWEYNGAVLSNVPAGDNTNEWHSVSVESDPIPVAGELRLKLAQAGQSPAGTKETHYKNIRLEIFRSTAGVLEITGQEHTQIQPPTIHNTSVREIHNDDAPSAPIAGALFLYSFTGPLQDLTNLWNVGGASETGRLGQFVTRDEMMARFKQRTKLEGAVLRSDITPLTVVLYAMMTGKNFVPGRVEVGYRETITDITLYEQYEDGESENDLPEDYRFRYIYNTK